MATFNFRSRDLRDFKLTERPRQRSGTQRVEPSPSVPALDFEDTAIDDDGCWLASSYELKRGLQVSEESIDTLPADLRDAFDPPLKERRRGPR